MLPAGSLNHAIGGRRCPVRCPDRPSSDRARRLMPSARLRCPSSRRLTLAAPRRTSKPASASRAGHARHRSAPLRVDFAVPSHPCRTSGCNDSRLRHGSGHDGARLARRGLTAGRHGTASHLGEARPLTPSIGPPVVLLRAACSLGRWRRHQGTSRHASSRFDRRVRRHRPDSP